MRVVSTDMRLVSTGSRRSVASSTIPVSPIPPTVAQNSSTWPGSAADGPTSTTEPSASRSRSDSTDEPNEPSRWWFLPWMSLAMAPPTVTCIVPGRTETKNPWGNTRCSSSPRLIPAGTTTVPAPASSCTSPEAAASRSTNPPLF